MGNVVGLLGRGFRGKRSRVFQTPSNPCYPTLRETLDKVLILGSGAIKVAEAAEFDYSGSQAIKAVKEEGLKVVVVNPNVATIQTSEKLADSIYLVPVEARFVETVIERERPDAIMLGFGGQTALNCGVELYKRGILDKYGVKVLGTPIQGIVKALDRGRFRETMLEYGLPIPPSKPAYGLNEALRIADEIGYPVMIRVAFNLGGAGSFIAHSPEELKINLEKAFAQSPVRQVLVEKSVYKWKEVEFEVVRDYKGNMAAVACMENFDPMGVHTGDSIVVAPSQTLTNREYHALRSASLKVAEAIGIIGECNVQLALNPFSEEYFIIETNPRMSRSSALASKATGYPLAYIAAKLALGYTLPELVNKVTGRTTAHFEPSLDYVIVKYPRWDFQKFRGVDCALGTEMKSIGEVMAIGRCFEEALQKALRMLDIGLEGVESEHYVNVPLNDLLRDIAKPSPDRVLKIASALKRGVDPVEISRITGIDAWYIYKLLNIVELERKLKAVHKCKNEKMLCRVLKEAKRLGFSDDRIARCLGWSTSQVREFRRRHGIVPVVKQIDTLAAEWPATTNYLYVSYGGEEDDIRFDSKKHKIMILGAGVFRIGVSVEFDWCVVELAWALKNRGVDEVIVVNYNPETVSTDWDVNDKLYFEELTLERILDIYEKEKPEGVITFVGGQIANNLALKLEKMGVKLLGTSGKSVDIAEDRRKFSRLLEKLGIPQPSWSEFNDVEKVRLFCKEIGYPVLIRPSYVLSGSAMKVIYCEEDLNEYLKKYGDIIKEHPLVVSKFMHEAKEVEVDAVSDGERVFIGAVIEHVEPAGVHSGDSTMVIPPFDLDEKTIETVKKYTYKICRALNVKGPVNIQYLVKNGKVYVIECNLRASRSMPFTSKATGINLMELVADVLVHGRLKLPANVKCYLPKVDWWAIKSPQFSWTRFRGAVPELGVEMRSTGEVASLGENLYITLLRSWLAAAPNRLPERDQYILLAVDNEDDYNILSNNLTRAGFKVIKGNPENPLLYKLLREGKVGWLISTSTDKEDSSESTSKLKRLAVDLNIPVILDGNLAKFLVEAVHRAGNPEIYEVKSLKEYWRMRKNA